MASPVTYSDLSEGVGEFLKLPPSDWSNLFPQEDAVKDPDDMIAPYNDAAWEQAVNDVRDIHRFDITGSLSEEIETIVKAAVCNLILAFIYEQKIIHSKDINAVKAVRFRTRYQNIIGRTRVWQASGRVASMGRSNRLVRM